MMRASFLTPLLAAGALVLAGCTLAPAYTRPGLPTPGVWPQGPAYKPATATSRNAPDIGWREYFADPKLTIVIEQALANNRDLRVAIANIESARGQYVSQRAALFPSISADLNAARTRAPAGAATPGASGHVTSTSYSANLAATAYELDLFGAARSRSRAARERYLASAEGRRAFQIALVSEVAAEYLTIAADQSTIEVARMTLSSSEESYELARRRFEGGVASELDLAQAETLLEQARGDVARATTIAAQARNALDLLVGASVEETVLAANLDDQQIPSTEIPAGLTSDVLLRRPDVLEAEHQLKAANADIGAARAAFFPNIILTAATGGASAALSAVLDGRRASANGAAGVSEILFAGGQRVGALAAARGAKKAALAQYEKTIQVAFREVADALAERGTIDEQSDAQQKLTDAATVSARLSSARYERGVDGYLATLDARRTLYAAQRGLITVKLGRALSDIALYRALGGGLDDGAGAALR